MFFFHVVCMIGEARVPDQAALPEESGILRRDDAHGSRRLRVQVLAGPRGDGPRHRERAGDFHAGGQRLQQVCVGLSVPGACVSCVLCLRNLCLCFV